jgi:hypothetical protein
MAFEERVQVVEQRIGQRVQQVVLGRAVLAHRGLAHTGGGGQLGDCGAVAATVGETSKARTEQFVAAVPRTGH